MKLLDLLAELFAGSYTSENDPKYKKSVSEFKKNLLAIDYEKKKKEKKDKKKKKLDKK